MRFYSFGLSDEQYKGKMKDFLETPVVNSFALMILNLTPIYILISGN